MSSVNDRIQAHPTLFNGIQYRSRLEAKWAAFFQRINWNAVYEPIDFVDWVPDFFVDGGRYRQFYVEVKPYYSIEEFKNHPAADPKNFCGRAYGYPSLLCGIDPSVMFCSNVETNSGGYQPSSASDFGLDYQIAWAKACTETQWRP